ncbi:hypothetical protein Tco_0135629 [Tanacetum coccineum]
MGTKVATVFQFLSNKALFEGRFLISTTTCMDERMCYIISVLSKGIKTHLGISQEVGTPRYLSLVVPLTKVGDEAVHKELDDRMERAATTASSLEAEQDSGNIYRTQSMATLNESFPQGTNSGSGPRFNTLGSGKDNMKLKELMEFYTKLSERALELCDIKTDRVN